MTERFQLVGSLLRPQNLVDIKNGIQVRDDVAYPFYDDVPGYRETEVEATNDVVAKEKQHGINPITDGEYTKSLWHTDFMWGLQGAERVIADHGYLFQDIDGEGTYETRKDIGARVVAPLSGKNHHFIDCWKRVAAQADGREVKQCIPSPAQIFSELSGVLWGGPHAGKVEGVYDTVADLREGLLNAYKEFIDEYVEAGGKILQLDDCIWSFFADDNESSPFAAGQSLAEQGAAVAQDLIDANNEVADYARSKGLKIWTHNCRGNYESRHAGEGSYAAIAELFLSQLRYDRFFLEWDDERAGSVDALNVFEGRDDVEVVLGVLSSKTTELDDEDRALRLLGEAAKILPKDQLFVSHQCGFASCDTGNELSIDEQWAKVDQGRKIAAEFWG